MKRPSGRLSESLDRDKMYGKFRPLSHVHDKKSLEKAQKIEEWQLM
jgi:hypothetical protein